MATGKPCRDCYPDGHGIKSSMVPARPRPAPHPGPRCASHWREELKRRKAAAHERHLERTYNMPPGTYARLLALQGGSCYMCRRAKGISKKLAIDHAHDCCPETPTCGRCTRGLLCSPCNKGVLGHARDDPAFFARCIAYLANPPYRQLHRDQT